MENQRINIILYIQFGDWYVWTLKPRPHEWMIYGVWMSYDFEGRRKRARLAEKKCKRGKK